MSRPPRKLSQTGLYHIIFRGINRQNIFEEDDDYKKMLAIIKKVKQEKKFEIYAYCFMSNHVHLFLKENVSGDIKKIMHKILTQYVSWYNYKYERSGSLIGNRYKSEPVEDDSYYAELIKYIHLNPIKAKISKSIEDYPWCSYTDYLEESDCLTDVDFLLSMLCKNEVTAQEEYIKMHEEREEMYFSIPERKRLTDEQAKEKIRIILKDKKISELSQLSKDDRNRYIYLLRKDGDISIRQLERLTGISRGILSRVKIM